MKIGLDLDNTIVDCDALFQRQAEQLLGHSLAGRSREDMRDLVRETHGDEYWTRIQAEVYGPLYQECRPCFGAIEAIARITDDARAPEIIVISHKTMTDAAGKNYKLRDYAFQWIERHLLNRLPRLVRAQICFTQTMDEKRKMIVDRACDIFLDDLPEIIMPLQGKISHPILFSKSPANHPLKMSLHICDWPAFGAFVADA